MRLSVALVKAVLGESVPWPLHHSVTDVEAMSKGSASIPWETDADAEIGDQVDQGADNADTDDIVFDGWEFRTVFGVTEPLEEIVSDIVLVDAAEDEGKNEPHDSAPHSKKPLVADTQ